MRLWLRSHFSVSFGIILLASLRCWSAACCGGGFSVPTVIAGDDKAQLTSSLSMTEVVVDNVDSQGIWRQWTEHQRVQTIKVEGAHVLRELWQAGFSLPVIQRTALGESYSGLGDISGTLGYEYLSDWNYNPYRPKGIGFLQLIFPTGQSKAASEVGGLDSRGNGFWALGVGTLLTKTIGRWDAFGSFDLHHSFEKKVNSASLVGVLKPGNGMNYGVGIGYSFKDYRVGSSINWTQEDPIEISTSTGTQAGLPERYATAAISLAYLKSSEWSGSVSVTDQTLFGDPINTSLGRGISLQIQRRWSR